MADTYAAKPEGFAGWSPRRPIGISGSINPLTRSKITSSSLNIWKGSPVINATGGTCDLAVTAGGNEVNTIALSSGTATGGTFTITSAITGSRRGGTGLTFTGTTSALAYNATAAEVQAALDLILGAGNCSVTGSSVASPGYAVTFIGDLSSTNVANLTVTSSLTGSSPVLAVSETAGVKGYVTSVTLIGFAAEWESGTIANWPRNFGQAPINLEGPFATTTKEILIHPDTAGQVYTGNIWPTEVVATSMVGTSYDLGYNVSTGQFFVRTGSTTNTLVTVVGIPPGQTGVVGGKVDFIVKDGASIFH